MTTSVMAGRAIEIRRFGGETDRATKVLTALQHTAPQRDHWNAPWLVLWGPGGQNRLQPIRDHVAAGGRVIACDLAYWQREYKFRISIDAPHPQAWVMQRDWPAARVKADGISVADRWKANGPILIAGLGVKARAQYGNAVDVWEREQVAICRQRWPDRMVMYRRKHPYGPMLGGLYSASNAPIDQVLTGCSLLITWHSNVAVDAIRMGIPVVCKDGAAAAVCSSEIPTHPVPLEPEVRQRFLQNLAWFQWSPWEAVQCWAWLQELLA